MPHDFVPLKFSCAVFAVFFFPPPSRHEEQMSKSHLFNQLKMSATKICCFSHQHQTTPTHNVKQIKIDFTPSPSSQPQNGNRTFLKRGRAPLLGPLNQSLANTTDGEQMIHSRPVRRVTFFFRFCFSFFCFPSREESVCVLVH